MFLKIVYKKYEGIFLFYETSRGSIMAAKLNTINLRQT